MSKLLTGTVYLSYIPDMPLVSPVQSSWVHAPHLSATCALEREDKLPALALCMRLPPLQLPLQVPILSEQPLQNTLM